MGQVKPGYGPREPDGRGWDASASRSMPNRKDPDRRKKAGPSPDAAPSKTPRSSAKGLSVDSNQARRVANDALALSKVVRDNHARGVHDHEATHKFNETMAALHQVHPGLAQSVQAIHHVETKIAEAKRDGGKAPKGYEEHLKTAKSNLDARLKQGKNFVYDPRKGK